ncbi:MAG: NAD(P)H-dependent oxidoreductase subunit E [Gammaproteobacteria bacterium]|nr:NAD(P)H-dependent oxidoreductase subunit E [Gammaproteobacteria bacterium]MDH5323315.1 NAD(P)H-dependent oxidoreductase subunit E [Gammaproteobacteria bacterium]
MSRENYNQAGASELIRAHGNRPEMLVQILHAFMDRFGWISEEAVRQLASELNLSRADVHGVVSYYHDFRTSPAARHVVKICAAEACQAMGSRALIKHAEKSLRLNMHESNDKVTLEPVYCLGNCACSPAIMVDGKTFGRVSNARFDEIVAQLDRADS